MNHSTEQFHSIDDSQVFAWLKAQLEPEYEVIAEPGGSYFSQWQFHYRILRDGELIETLSGDFRDISPGSLASEARQVVAQLRNNTTSQTYNTAEFGPLPFASRLPPKRSATTWFGSGRAAFAWLMENEVRPKRIYLPSLICWSLLDVLQNRFPEIDVEFYSVSKALECEFPSALSTEEAVLFIHYFGRRASEPDNANVTIIEDLSHVPVGWFPPSPRAGRQRYRFGSLRKAYRVADGGYLEGRYNPVYENVAAADAWLRIHAKDWRDLREAENMTDRSWSIRDISSQSLEVILASDVGAAAQQRHENNRRLVEEFACGEPVVTFENDDFPLLHCRTFDDQSERDSLREYLARERLFTSIHWPLHDLLLRNRDRWDVEDALWLANHSLAIPVSEEFGSPYMDRVCAAARDWATAGAARFVPATTGQ